MLRQDTRQVRIKSALPENVLAFRSMRMSEGMSQLFEMQLELYSDEDGLEFDKVLGRNLTVALETEKGPEERYFNGFVTQFGFAGSHGRRFVYQAVASPWLWFLTRTETCRIFHESPADRIVSEVFRAHGFTDFEFRLSRAHPVYEYCVQYRESDFNFVSRLLEREGIHYHFEHRNGSHLLVLADSNSLLTEEPGYATIDYHAEDEFLRRRRECIHAWRPESRVQPTRVALSDYDFRKPAADLAASARIGRGHALGAFEVYDWPGAYRELAEGEDYARMRVEELQSQQTRMQAEATARGVKSGRLFTLAAHPVARFNAPHLIVSAIHHVASDDYESGADAEEQIYRCAFTAMPATEPFRPPRRTPKPLISGPQTAVVVGAEGEEIDPDEHGRVKVQFHWERAGSPSCRVRVSQAWAGAGWGAASIPRIGQEVIVEFEEGDPDRPIVTGRVYNAAQRAPYDPPARRNVTAFRTNTVKGVGFNELSFDDTAGAEGIFVHAQFDFDRRVRNDARDRVGRDRHATVARDAFEAVEANRHATVAVEERLTVGDSRHVRIGEDDLRAAGRDIVDLAGGRIHLKADGTAVVEAPGGVTLRSGGSFVTVSPVGVFIRGPVVLINSGGAALAGPGTRAAAAAKPAEPQERTGGRKDPRARARSRAPTPEELDSHPVAAALRRAAQSGAPFCEICG